LFKTEACIGAKTHDQEMLLLESVHSFWLFDTERRRFRRVLKGLKFNMHEVETGWRPYFRVDFDQLSGSFVVLLNLEGTRILRPQCGGAEKSRAASRQETSNLCVDGERDV
jgi:hypothetical protein